MNVVVHVMVGNECAQPRFAKDSAAPLTDAEAACGLVGTAFMKRLALIS